MTNDLDMHMGRRLRDLRKRRGLTLEKLGRRTGIRFQQLHRYEIAQNSMPAARLWVIADALEVDAGYFFRGLRGPAGDGLTR